MTTPATAKWASDAGVSHRQLDYWTRQGWLHPVNKSGGSGVWRIWPEEERRVVRIMARLVAAGIVPMVAAGIARQASVAGADESCSIITVTPDVTVMVGNE